MSRRRLGLAAASCRLLVCALVLAAGTAQAAWVPVSSPDPGPLQVTVRESAPERTVLEFTLPGYDQQEVLVEGEPCLALSVPGEPLLMVRGFPEVPMARRSLIVDDQMAVAVRVLEVDRFTTPVGRVIPSKGHLNRSVDPATVPYEFGPAYQQDAWYPAESLAADDPFVVRDFRGVTVEFRPLSYNPVKGELQICRRLVVEVSRGTGPAVNPLVHRPAGGDDGVFQAAYREMFMNYDRLGLLLYTPIPEPGRLVIITADQFYADVVPFLQWKLQMGRPTELVKYSQIGSGGAAIKSYLQSLYNSPDGLTYVVLVGDVAQIPTLYGSYEGAPSDPSYAMMTPGDYYPDILLSRFSAQTSDQVATQVSRMIRYERNPDTGAAAVWYHQATGIGSNESGGTPYRDWERVEFLRQDLLAYTYTLVDQIYDPGATAAQVTAAINGGRSLVNYIGHGSTYAWGTTGFSTTHVHNLTNGHKLPFIVDVACLNGDLTAGECFAEAWLRSGTAEAPKGAIAMYAASTLASWVPPCDMQTHVVDLMVAEQRNTVGGLCFSGAMKTLDLWGSGEGRKLVEQYNIFGDASLVIRTDAPTTMVVSHLPSLQTSVPTFAVDVPGVSGALAALYDNGLLYGYAYTDAGGHAVITMDDPPTQAGSITLTVTAFNRVPYIATIPVISVEGPYLVCLGSLLDDDTFGRSSGNGDGGLDAGETVELGFRVWNMGSDPATGATATLTTGSPWVTLIDANASLGDIPSGDTLVVEDSLVFAIPPDCPDGEVVTLTLRLAAAAFDSSQDLAFGVKAPVLAIAGCEVLDAAPGGDGDGVAEPGEEVMLRLRVANSGSGWASGVTAYLTSIVAAWAEVTQDSAGAWAIPAGATVVLLPNYAVSVAPGAPSMALCPMRLEASGAWGLDWTGTFDMPIGGLYDDVEDGVGTWTHAVVTPSFVDQWHRTMLENHTPGGRWAWMFGATLEGDYANHADGALMSGSLELGEGSMLTFWHKIDAETSAAYPGYAPDGGIVEVSVEGGPWQEIAPRGGYPYRIRNGASPGPFAAETPCFSGTRTWREETLDLSGESGTARIRFRFGTDGANGGEGWVLDDLKVIGGELPASGVEEREITLTPAPVTVHLGPSRPNPSSATTVIDYGLPQESQVDLAIYDVEGRRIRTLATGRSAAGLHSAVWDGRDEGGDAVVSGIYFLRLVAGGESVSRAMVLMR